MIKKWRNILKFLGIIVFLIWFFYPSETYTIFSFIDDNDKIINGEVFFDSEYFGTTKKGDISVPYLEKLPQEMKFRGTYQEETFEIIYDFPFDYFEYSEVPFLVSQEGIDYSIKHKNIIKGDQIFVTYSFNVIQEGNKKIICDINRKNNVRKVFDTIKNETGEIFIFEEVEDGSDIEIKCLALPKADIDYGIYTTFTRTRGLATQGILGEKIEGNITFYGKTGEHCSSLEAHEILHVFGFGHTPSGIMKPVNEDFDCNDNIDDYIIEDLIKYYR